ncbi:SPOR domain-containing protein [Epilithonimonas zeae]|uniref:SPOR domain-containing protein n=1 Tax=Epilithonimonas zeae TaxID=1416779 RepID=UPI00201058E8|nr:SPOR domain-containing protein [Epilithonimonas zeae]UQB68140.1 SPOR domain-containing protein [Epilithonimonas zeae]
MNHLFKLFIFSALFCFYQIDAQYVVKKDTLSGTELSFSLDERVNDALEKIEDKCDRNVGAPTKTPTKVLVASRELTNAEICRKNPKIMGFKIQVVIVKSNDEARKIATEFRGNFRNLKVETDASLRPNYKILAGSYFSKQSASDDLRNISKIYPSARVIPYAVFCVEAK